MTRLPRLVGGGGFSRSHEGRSPERLAMVKVSVPFGVCEDIAHDPWHMVSGGTWPKRGATGFDHGTREYMIGE